MLYTGKKTVYVQLKDMKDLNGAKQRGGHVTTAAALSRMRIRCYATLLRLVLFAPPGPVRSCVCNVDVDADASWFPSLPSPPARCSRYGRCGCCCCGCWPIERTAAAAEAAETACVQWPAEALCA